MLKCLCVRMLSHFSHVQLCVTLWIIARQAPLSMARILEWVAISSSRESFQPRDWTQLSFLAGRFFTIWATREALPPHQYDLFGNRVFADVELKWGHLVWALIQYDWCPYKKRKFGLRHTQGEYHMKTGVMLSWTEELRRLLAGEA